MTPRHSKARRQLLQAARRALAALVAEGLFVRGPQGYAPVWERIAAWEGQ